MKKMKSKQWVSVLLCMLLCVCMQTVIALADVSYGFSITNNESTVWVYSSNAEDVLDNGMISYDAETSTLTLKDCHLTVTSANQAAIYVPSDSLSLKIKLEGDNTITGDQCIFTNGSLEISGNGTLNVEGGEYAVYAGQNLTIDSAAVSANTSATNSAGIETRGSLIIKNGSDVTGSSSGGWGINANKGITITDSTVTSTSSSSNDNSCTGMFTSNGNITITDSEIISSSKNNEGIYASFGNVTITKSNVDASTENGGCAIYGEQVKISGGTVTATAEGDKANAIYSGDSGIEISNGATVTAKATSTNSYPALRSKAGVSISNSNVTAEAGESNAIYSPDDIKIVDSIVEATSEGSYPALCSDAGVSVSNSNVTATAGDASPLSYGGCAIYGKQVKISGGTVTATAGDNSNAICSGSAIEISDGATVTAKATSTSSYPALYGTTGVSVSDSNVTAESGGDVAIYSPNDINIVTSIVNAAAPNGTDGIMANGSSSVSDSWISTSGNESFENNIENSVLINGTSGKVIRAVKLPGDVTLPAGTTLEFTDGSSLTVPDGVIFNCNSHTGGTATCKDKAVCEICGKGYGEVNATNHTNLVKTEAKSATHLTEGNIEYWCCDGCKKYFSDAECKTEITLADIVIPKLADHTADGKGWYFDENNHWNICLECSEKIDEAAHSLKWVVDKEATTVDTGSKHEECTVCGYAKAPVEIPAIVDSNDSNDSSDSNDDSSDEIYYSGINSLSSSEQDKVERAAASVFGSVASVASAEKTANGICITSDSRDIIFSKNNGTLSANEWQLVGKDWYYFGSDKKAVRGWQLVNDEWYLLDSTNANMKTGWQFVNDKWYLLDSINGDMKTDWQLVNDKWYLLDSINGDMKTGWQLVNGKWYYLAASGEMAENTITPDGYRVDKTGAWTGEKVNN